MEANDLKNIWKLGVEKSIHTYSEDELRRLMIKAVRKAISPIYPLWEYILLILTILFMIWKASTYSTMAILILDVGIIILLLVLLFSALYFRKKMLQDNKNNNIKEWVKYRLTSVENSYKRKIKYKNLILTGCTILALSIVWIYSYYQNTSLIRVGIVSVFLIIFNFVVLRVEHRRYKKTIWRLKKLYKQFEE